ncbi:hypothetical protein BDZ91DRAFT_767469 [Kalaharituber pfeilii]|nr:hypothetical protein BDZ91DRAFT_767469 [Kalaharituber pfeilii]
MQLGFCSIRDTVDFTFFMSYGEGGIGIGIGYSLTTYITTQWIKLSLNENWIKTRGDRWVLKCGGFQGNSPQSSGPGENLPIDFLGCGAVIPDGFPGSFPGDCKIRLLEENLQIVDHEERLHSICSADYCNAKQPNTMI